MMTQKEIYRQVLAIYESKHKQRERFASSIITFFFVGESGKYYDEARDPNVIDLFDNCVRIEDGEAAFSKWELEKFWQEIEDDIAQMRQVVAEETSGGVE